ncbi:MAG: hypothetical protein RLP09_16885 [Sandaracinaceae bacterium]
MYVEPRDLLRPTERNRWRASFGELFGGALSVGLVVALAFAPSAVRRAPTPERVTVPVSARAKIDPTPTPVEAPAGLELPDEPALESPARVSPAPEARRRRRARPARARSDQPGLDDVLRSARELSDGS